MNHRYYYCTAISIPSPVTFWGPQSRSHLTNMRQMRQMRQMWMTRNEYLATVHGSPSPPSSLHPPSPPTHPSLPPCAVSQKRKRNPSRPLSAADHHLLLLLLSCSSMAVLQVKYTNLDTVGRPVVVLKKRNVVPEHSVQYLQVSYSFTSMALLAEPFLLVGAFLLFFLSLIAYSRMDLTISKSTAAYQAKVQNEQVQPPSTPSFFLFFYSLSENGECAHKGSGVMRTTSE